MRCLIAIDGPAAVGKSTTAKALAQVLGWPYLDTGAMYRAAALALDRAGVALDDPSGLERVLGSLDLVIVGNRQLLGGEDVTELLRSPERARKVSAVAACAQVREALVGQQRRLAGAGGWVVDGRDIGTTVFPDACCKIFLTASMAARAQRRFLEQEAKGLTESLESVAADLLRRDQGVTSRTVAPLRKAEDAVELDSTFMSLEEVVAWIVAGHRGHGQGAG